MEINKYLADNLAFLAESGDPMPSGWDYVKFIIKFLEAEFLHSNFSGHKEDEAHFHEHESILHRLRDDVRDLGLISELVGITLAENIFLVLTEFIGTLDAEVTGHKPSDHNFIVKLLLGLRGWINKELEAQVADDLDVTRFFIIISLSIGYGLRLALGRFGYDMRFSIGQLVQLFRFSISDANVLGLALLVIVIAGSGLVIVAGTICATIAMAIT